jgi:hypothetical protein
MTGGGTSGGEWDSIVACMEADGMQASAGDIGAVIT